MGRHSLYLCHEDALCLAGRSTRMGQGKTETSMTRMLASECLTDAHRAAIG